MYLSEENFLDMTEGLRESDGSLTRESFNKWMMRELKIYMQRQLDKAIITSSSESSLGLLCGLKLLITSGSEASTLTRAYSHSSLSRMGTVGESVCVWQRKTSSQTSSLKINEELTAVQNGQVDSTEISNAHLCALMKEMSQKIEANNTLLLGLMTAQQQMAQKPDYIDGIVEARSCFDPHMKDKFTTRSQFPELNSDVRSFTDDSASTSTGEPWNGDSVKGTDADKVDASRPVETEMIETELIEETIQSETYC